MFNLNYFKQLYFLTMENDYRFQRNSADESCPQYMRLKALTDNEAETLRRELDFRDESKRRERIFMKYVAPFAFSPKDPRGFANLFNMANFYYNLFYFNQRE
jgi:hypothetical protein